MTRIESSKTMKLAKSLGVVGNKTNLGIIERSVLG